MAMAVARPEKISKKAERVAALTAQQTVQDDSMHRINVNFTGEAYEALTQLAKSQGKTMSEVLRDALTLEKWFDEARREGSRVLLERNGKTREIIWR